MALLQTRGMSNCRKLESLRGYRCFSSNSCVARPFGAGCLLQIIVWQLHSTSSLVSSGAIWQLSGNKVNTGFGASEKECLKSFLIFLLFITCHPAGEGTKAASLSFLHAPGGIRRVRKAWGSPGNQLPPSIIQVCSSDNIPDPNENAGRSSSDGWFFRYCHVLICTKRQFSAGETEPHLLAVLYDHRWPRSRVSA